MRITPERILEIGWDFAKSRVLATAVELDIFTHIANKRDSAKDIADAAKTNLRATEMLLNALAGLGLLKKKDGRYSLAPDSKEFLVRGKPSYLGSMSGHTVWLNYMWSHLTKSVKSGKPYVSVEEERRAQKYFPQLVRALFNMNYPAARCVALYLKRKKKKILDILDVASGSGVWGIGIGQEFRDAKIKALDFSSVLDITREYANNFKMQDRYGYIKGDLRRIDFGKRRYDLVILGHICHSEGRLNTQRLIKKSYDSLKNGGVLVIADFFSNKDKSGPLFPLLFAINMLLSTNEGDVFSIEEFSRWLKRSGFKKVEILKQVPARSPIILAAK